MKASTKKIILLAAVVIVIIAAFPYAREYLTFEQIKESQAEFTGYYEQNRLLVITLYFLGYVGVTALSLPGALIMTLAAGALFGFIVGSILVSFASSIGATLAFLVARYLVGESLQRKYAAELKKFNEQMAKEGAFYLFALRLIPAVPFFLINILMALTRIRTVTFYWVSQLGMLAGTLVYVNAGTQIASIESPGDIVSAPLIGSFVLLAVVPLVAKKVVAYVRRRNEPKGTEPAA